MGVFLTLLVLAVVCEAVVEWLKHVFTLSSPLITELTALMVGLILAFGSQVDLFDLIGIEFVIPYVGAILAGFLIGRGSNYIHDFSDRLKGLNSAE